MTKSKLKLIAGFVLMSCFRQIANAEFSDPFAGGDANQNEGRFNTAYAVSGFDAGNLQPYQKGEVSEVIDPHKGGLKLINIDYVFKGSGGMTLPITRVYQNQQNAASRLISGNVPDGQDYMGIGWALHFGRIFVSDVHPVGGGWRGREINAVSSQGDVCTNFGSNNEAAQKNPILEMPNGSKEVLYVAHTPGDASQFLTMSHWVGRCITQDDADSGDLINGGIIIFSPEGWKYTFNKFGRLTTSSAGNWGYPGAGVPPLGYPTSKWGYVPTKIEDMNGNTIIINYTPNDESSIIKIDSVIFQGNTIDFSYDGEKLHQISGEGVTLTYTHDGQYLRSVNIAGELSWNYTYYPSGGVGANSLNVMTSPTGLNTTYTYSENQFVPNLGGEQLPVAVTDGLLSVGVYTKVVSGSGINSETTTYRYYPGGTGGEKPKDITTVEFSSGNQSYTTEYQHVGYHATPPGGLGMNSEMYRRSTLLSKTISGGGKTQTETFTYDKKAFISNANTWQAYPNQAQNFTWVPLLTRKEISRSGEGAASVINYTYTDLTAYPANQDVLPSPINIQFTNPVVSQTESGNAGSIIKEFKWGGNSIIFRSENGKLSAYKTTYGGYKLTDENNKEFSYYNTIDDRGRVQLEDKNGITKKFTYYGSGDVLTIDKPVSGTGCFAEPVTDCVSETTAFSDYEKGVPKTITMPDGVEITRSDLDARGNVLSETVTKASDSATTTKQYDGLNRVTQINPPENGTSDIVDIDYVNTTTETSRTVTRGAYAQVSLYDEKGRLSLETENEISKKYEYDYMGNVTFSSDSGAAPNLLTKGQFSRYDIFGRLVSSWRSDDPNSKTDYVYGAENSFKRTQVTRSITALPGGQPTAIYVDSMYYKNYGSPDELNLVKIKQDKGGGTFIETDISRFGSGRIESVTQGGITQQFFYDDAHGYTTDVVGIVRPDVGMGFCQDGQGRTIREFKFAPPYSFDVSDRSTTCGMEYVSNGSMKGALYQNGHLAWIKYGDDWGNPINFGYNKFGQISSAVRGATGNPSHDSWTGIYDDNGNLETENIVRHGKSLSFNYAINALDHVWKMTYPNGDFVTYDPDVLGRPTNIRYTPTSGGSFIDMALNMSYWPNGQINAYQLGNGLNVTNSQKEEGLPLPDVFSVSGAVMHLQYNYDGVGNVTSIADALDVGLDRTGIGYDGIGRLTGVNVGGVLHGYSYNDRSDIEATQVGANSCDYQYDGSTYRLAEVTGSCGISPFSSVSYDSSGNITGKYINNNGSQTNIGGVFSFNQAGQLNRYNNNNYASYDVAGNRSLTKINTIDNIFRDLLSIYSASGQLMSEIDPISIGDNYRNYVYAGNQLLGKIDNCVTNGNKPDGENNSIGICSAADDDSDGLSFAEENGFQSNPFDSDSDNDGMDDGLEHAANTNPNNPDTDSDGINDPEDFAPNDPSRGGSYLDAGFGSSGIYYQDYRGEIVDAVQLNHSGYPASVQSDIMVLSYSQSCGGAAIQRLNSDGTKDNQFGTQGSMCLDFNKDYYSDVFNSYSILQLDDGSLLISGDNIHNENGVNYLRHAIYKIDIYGRLDASFGDNGAVYIDKEYYNEATGKLRQLANGSLLLSVGAEYNSDSHYKLIKLLPSGELDTGFGGDGAVNLHDLFPVFPIHSRLWNSTIDSVLWLQNGDLIIAGATSTVDENLHGYCSPILLKLNADGTADTGFGNNGTILVNGYQPVAVRGDCGLYGEDGITAMAQVDDDWIAVMGHAENRAKTILTKVNIVDGSLDESFGMHSGWSDFSFRPEPDPEADSQFVACESLIHQFDGKLVAGCMSVTKPGDDLSDFVIVRFTQNGMLDTSFDGSGFTHTSIKHPYYSFGADAYSYSLDIQSDGKYLLSGYSDYSNIYYGVMARYVIDIDSDMDGCYDNADRYPSNPAECFDHDGDGAGDNADEDDDNDGVVDSAEVASGTNQFSSDTDKDGISDSVDHCPINYAVNDVDTDGDLVFDACDSDDDNDGVTDNIERAVGTSINNPSSVPYVVHVKAHKNNFEIDELYLLSILNNSSGIEFDSISSAGSIQRITEGSVQWVNHKYKYVYPMPCCTVNSDAALVTALDGGVPTTSVVLIDMYPAGDPLVGFTAVDYPVAVIDDGADSTYSGGHGNDVLIDGEGNDVLQFASGSGDDIAWFKYSATNKSNVIQFDGLNKDEVAYTLRDSHLEARLLSPNTGTLTLVDFAGDVFHRAISGADFDDSDYPVKTFAVDDKIIQTIYYGYASGVETENYFSIIEPSFLMENDFVETGSPAINYSEFKQVSNLRPGSPIYNNNWGFENLVLLPVNEVQPIEFSYRVSDRLAIPGSIGERAFVKIIPGTGTTITGNADNEILLGAPEVIESFNAGAGNDSIHTGNGADQVNFNPGDGKDILDLSGEGLPGDTVQLGSGILPASIQVRRDKLDMVINASPADSMRLVGFYANDQWTLPGVFPNGVMNFNSLHFLSDSSDLSKSQLISMANQYNSCDQCNENANSFSAGSSNSFIFGLGGDDNLVGGNGDDQIGGDSGNDFISPNGGTNWITGGSGSDTYYFNDSLSQKSQFSVVENFDLGTGLQSGTGNNDVLNVVNPNSGDILMLRDGMDLLLKWNTVYGESQVRVLSFFGSWGFSTLNVNLIDDIYGPVMWDPDCIDFSGATRCIKNRVLTDALLDDGDPAFADDELIGYEVGGLIHGGLGNDHIITYDADDTLYGDQGNDVLESGGGSMDVLYGGDGNDTLNGGWGENALYGESGDDDLIAIGPYGMSILDGGPGSDRYKVSDNARVEIHPVVVGDSGSDSLEFTGDLQPVDLWMEDSGGDLIIHVIPYEFDFTITDWNSPDSQLDLIEAGGCSISRSNLEALVLQTGGVMPSPLTANQLLVDAYWYCP